MLERRCSRKPPPRLTACRCRKGIPDARRMPHEGSAPDHSRWPLESGTASHEPLSKLLSARCLPSRRLESELLLRAPLTEATQSGRPDADHLPGARVAAGPVARVFGAAGRWRVDETYCHLNGRWAYCYRAIDQDGQVADVYLSERRNAAAARAFFERAIAETRVRPERVVTDKAA